MELHLRLSYEADVPKTPDVLTKPAEAALDAAKRALREHPGVHDETVSGAVVMRRRW